MLSPMHASAQMSHYLQAANFEGYHPLFFFL